VPAVRTCCICLRDTASSADIVVECAAVVEGDEEQPHFFHPACCDINLTEENQRADISKLQLSCSNCVTQQHTRTTMEYRGGNPLRRQLSVRYIRQTKTTIHIKDGNVDDDAERAVNNGGNDGNDGSQIAGGDAAVARETMAVAPARSGSDRLGSSLRDRSSSGGSSSTEEEGDTIKSFSHNRIKQLESELAAAQRTIAHLLSIGEDAGRTLEELRNELSAARLSSQEENTQLLELIARYMATVC
jgi:hypothetical protein